jgi:ATP-dependent DNA helicase DinG
LVASMSFWEGVDIPGQALQLVVIDKLPFPVPDDPLVRAFGERARAQGLSPFAAHALPAAAVALKQGAGRLIRTESDKGLLIVGDVRLQRQSYGARLRRAMPIHRHVAPPEALQAWLVELTKAATMDATGQANPR